MEKVEKVHFMVWTLKRDLSSVWSSVTYELMPSGKGFE